MILVISHHRDEHAQAVMVELSRREVATRLLDLARFPLQLCLSMHYDGAGGSRFLFGCDEEKALDLRECGAIWWRRPQQPSVADAIRRAAHQNFALSESHEALTGLWQSVDAFWVNEPARDVVANRKAYQLKLAAELGLEIPRTLISNCHEAVRDFVKDVGVGKVIYKAFSATEQDWRETRLLREEELDKIDNVKYAPVIFQSYVEADVDLRITVIGDRIFPAAIHSQETSYKVDFRMDIAAARIEPAALPDDIADKLLKLMRALGLTYGAIDMRRRPDGSHVFLEVNPAGQWLFIERRTGQKITDALATLLQENDRHRRGPAAFSSREGSLSEPRATPSRRGRPRKQQRNR